MYLVDFDIFNEFIIKKEVANIGVPVCGVTPAIIEYYKSGVLLAKVEVVNFKEYNFLKKFSTALHKNPVINRKKKSKNVSKNKFWIRGDEWKVIDNQQVMKLSY